MKMKILRTVLLSTALYGGLIATYLYGYDWMTFLANLFILFYIFPVACMGLLGGIVLHASDDVIVSTIQKCKTESDYRKAP